jgi:hypothetical protein
MVPGVSYASRGRTQRAIEVGVQSVTDGTNVVTRISLEQALSDQDVDFRFA